MKRISEIILGFLEKFNPQLVGKIKASMTSRLGQGFSWNMASLVILAASGFLMNALIVAARGEEALGVFNQVYAIYLIFSQIVVFGLHHSVLRLVSVNYQERDYCSEITTSALILILVISIPATALSLLLIRPISALLDSPDVIYGLIYTLPSLVFFSVNKVLINVLNGLDEMKSFSFFRSLRYILIPLIIFLIIVFNLESRYISLSLSICEVILTIWLTVYIYGKVLPRPKLAHFRALAREHLNFGYKGFLSGLLIGINTKIDVLMIGAFLTDTHVGIYSFAAVLAEGLYEITVVAQLTMNPLIGKAFAHNDHKSIETLSRDFRKMFYPLMIFIGAISIAVYPLIVRLFADPSYLIESWVIFSLIVIGIVIDSGYGAMRGLIMQGNRPGLYTLYILALVIGDALLNLVMIPLLGIIGAGLVTMLTYILSMLYLIRISQRQFAISL